MVVKITYSTNTRNILANNIVYYRVNVFHWSQEELALKLGTDSPYVSELENGKRKASVDYIGLLADVFQVKPYEMLIERPPIKNRRIDR